MPANLRDPGKQWVGLTIRARTMFFNTSLVKPAQLSTYEQLQTFVIVKEPWSIENGMLTPTMKIKRAPIESAVKPHLDAWFESKKPVQWWT